MSEFDESKPINLGGIYDNVNQNNPVNLPSQPSVINKTTIHNPNENSMSGNESTSPNYYPANTNVDFDVGAFYSFLNDKGLDTLWERSFLCTCVDPTTQSPDPACPICHGSGIAYLAAQKLRILIQSQKKGVSYQDVGLMDSGTALGTPQVNASVSFRDRISVPDVNLIQSYIFDLNDDRLSKGIRIPYDPNKFLLVTDGTNNLIEEQDFSYDKENHIFKIINPAISSGVNISMNMQVTLRYIVVDLLKESRYQYTSNNMANGKTKFDRLPELLLLKREDAWIGNSSFVATSKSNAKFNDPKREMNPDISGFGLDNNG